MTMPKLSVLVTDEEMQQIVRDYIQMCVTVDNEYGCCMKWDELVEHGCEESIPTIERLRIAYNL